MNLHAFYIIASLVTVQAGLLRRSDPLDACPISLPRSWHLFAYTDTCLEIVHEEESWNGAREHCKQLGGDLVTIQDAAKQQFIMDKLKSLNWDRKGVWIGGTDADTEGNWIWANGGQKISWGYWTAGQGIKHGGFLLPQGFFLDCALIRTDDGYRWHEYACNAGPGFHYSSICEYPRTTTDRPTKAQITTFPTTIPTTITTTGTAVTTTDNPGGAGQIVTAIG